ncbi:MAG: BCCT family transporter, partial [Wenzhouxiangellaceae bacterium]
MSEEIAEALEAVEQIEQIYETDYEIGQDNVEKWGFDMHSPVFFVSALLIVIFVVGSLLFPERSLSSLEATREWIQLTFDWVLLSVGNVFVLFCFALIVLPVGSVRLGGDDAEPDFSVLSWF